MPLTTTPKVRRRSHDDRTQVWDVTRPKCGKVFTPVTTILATQRFECPARKCQASLYADYNAEPPTVKII